MNFFGKIHKKKIWGRSGGWVGGGGRVGVGGGGVRVDVNEEFFVKIKKKNVFFGGGGIGWGGGGVGWGWSGLM